MTFICYFLNYARFFIGQLHFIQFSSVAQLCRTLCNPMDCSTPGLPVHHQLPEFTQTPGDSKGQGSLACCSAWGSKESDTTEQQQQSNTAVCY